MNSLQEALARFGQILQGNLFPVLESELGPLGDLQRRFVQTVSMLQLEGFIMVRHGRGRPSHDRGAIARAFVAKALWNLPTTRALLDRLQSDATLRRLCGWETARAIPDETVFSRAFAGFAREQFGERVHAALIERTQKQRVIGHISRDSTAIRGWENPEPKPQQPATAGPKPRYRKKRSTPKPLNEMTRLERQCSGQLSVEEMVEELPRRCDVGTKTNSKRHRDFWVGYKLHLDVADGQIPISCLLTSASLHDSQAAVPLAIITAKRVTSLYDLMDRGYESDLIRQHSQQLGHVPIIDRQRRGDHPQQMLPHQAMRFRERTTVERVYARLKQEFGGENVRVRGWAKVMTHLMFGILALTVDQILRLAPS